MNIRRTTLITALWGLAVLGGLNYAIYDKEQTLAHGETLLMELAPVDPRSIMQGDYMRLRYAAANGLKAPESKVSGYVVMERVEGGAARFVRFDNGGALAPGQARLRYHASGGTVTLRPDSFFFQEGLAGRYNAAKYGIFAFDASGKALLVGLAGEDKQIITPIAEK